MDGAGNLYGTTFLGGPPGTETGYGAVFKVAKGSGTATTLATFPNPYFPSGGLIIDAAGNLYGTENGYYGTGGVFEVVKGSGTVTTLATFDGSDNGYPAGDGERSSPGLVMDAAGNLYGSSPYGGDAYGNGNGAGTVFELAKGSHNLTTLATFNGLNGSVPAAKLSIDGAGNIYGTTIYGPTDYGSAAYYNTGYGTVFEVAKGSGTVTDLAVFEPLSNGYALPTNPKTGVIVDGAGNLYGTTDASVFEVLKGSGVVTTLATVDPSSTGVGELVMDAAGNLFGTSNAYGRNNDYGTVFEVVNGSGTATTLANLDVTMAFPNDALIMDAAGNLYGTTSYANSQFPTTFTGTVFELSTGPVVSPPPPVSPPPGSPPPPAGPGLINDSPLAPMISGRLPSTSLVAGGKIAPITQTVRITNTSTGTINESVTVNLLLSNDPSGASGGTSVASVMRKVILKAGAFSNVPVTFHSLPANTTGTLYLLPEVTEPSGATGFSASSGTISAAAPFIDLAGSVFHVPATVKAGRKGVVTLSLVNNGNIVATGNLSIDLQASPNGTLGAAGSIDLGAVTRHVSIQPGRQLVLQFVETFPTTGGPYFIVANLDTANVFNDSNLSNNVFASATAVTLV